MPSEGQNNGCPPYTVEGTFLIIKGLLTRAAHSPFLFARGTPGALSWKYLVTPPPSLLSVPGSPAAYRAVFFSSPFTRPPTEVRR